MEYVRPVAPIGVSVGVAAFPSDGRSPSDLVAAADRALYQVKRSGGGGVRASADAAGGV